MAGVAGVAFTCPADAAEGFPVAGSVSDVTDAAEGLTTAFWLTGAAAAAGRVALIGISALPTIGAEVPDGAAVAGEACPAEAAEVCGDDACASTPLRASSNPCSIACEKIAAGPLNGSNRAIVLVEAAVIFILCSNPAGSRFDAGLSG